jgi:hypothetical protein
MIAFVHSTPSLLFFVAFVLLARRFSRADPRRLIGSVEVNEKLTQAEDDLNTKGR